MDKIISVIGLGKLGAGMAGAIADKGFTVIGVDINQHSVECLNSGMAPVQETNLDDIIMKNRKRLTATTSYREAVLKSDISFVIVPTPSDVNGAFSLQYAAWAFSEIGKVLAEKSRYHTIVITSTVLPGSTRYGLLPIIEKASGKRCGVDFGLCYSPEFIALGSVINDFLNPDFTLIGEFDERSGGDLQSFYDDIMENEPPCIRMSIENAELTKIALNTYITTKITFANMLADICELIPGGDVDAVCNALGMDSRIGRKYLTGAVGYGGPCFPRDNLSLTFLADTLDYKAELPNITDSINRSYGDTLARHISSYAFKGDTIAVLGLAYKPNTSVVEESQGIYLSSALSDSGFRVVAYDAMANERARRELKDRVIVMDSIRSCLEQAKVVVITLPDPEFVALDVEMFPKRNPPVIVYDCWRILRHKLEGAANLRYIPRGIGINDETGDKLIKHLWKLYDESAAYRAA